MRIKRTVEKDYRKVRDLRLAALQDSPNSFAGSLQDTKNKPTQYWVELTNSLCKEHVMFILEEEDGECVGSVYGLCDSYDAKVGRVAGLWVSSAYRGRGFGKALLKKVVIRAKSRELLEVRLWAPAKQSNIIEFYGSDGFELTGLRQQVSKPSLEIVEMKRVFGV